MGFLQMYSRSFSGIFQNFSRSILEIFAGVCRCTLKSHQTEIQRSCLVANQKKVDYNVLFNAKPEGEGSGKWWGFNMKTLSSSWV